MSSFSRQGKLHPQLAKLMQEKEDSMKADNPLDSSVGGPDSAVLSFVSTGSSTADEATPSIVTEVPDEELPDGHVQLSSLPSSARDSNKGPSPLAAVVSSPSAAAFGGGGNLDEERMLAMLTSNNKTSTSKVSAFSSDDDDSIGGNAGGGDDDTGKYSALMSDSLRGITDEPGAIGLADEDEAPARKGVRGMSVLNDPLGDGLVSSSEDEQEIGDDGLPIEREPPSRSSKSNRSKKSKPRSKGKKSKAKAGGRGRAGSGSRSYYDDDDEEVRDDGAGSGRRRGRARNRSKEAGVDLSKPVPKTFRAPTTIEFGDAEREALARIGKYETKKGRGGQADPAAGEDSEDEEQGGLPQADPMAQALIPKTVKVGAKRTAGAPPPRSTLVAHPDDEDRNDGGLGSERPVPQSVVNGHVILYTTSTKVFVPRARNNTPWTILYVLTFLAAFVTAVIPAHGKGFFALATPHYVGAIITSLLFGHFITFMLARVPSFVLGLLIWFMPVHWLIIASWGTNFITTHDDTLMKSIVAIPWILVLATAVIAFQRGRGLGGEVLRRFQSALDLIRFNGGSMQSVPLLLSVIWGVVAVLMTEITALMAHKPGGGQAAALAIAFMLTAWTGAIFIDVSRMSVSTYVGAWYFGRRTLPQRKGASYFWYDPNAMIGLERGFLSSFGTVALAAAVEAPAAVLNRLRGLTRGLTGHVTAYALPMATLSSLSYCQAARSITTSISRSKLSNASVDRLLKYALHGFALQVGIDFALAVYTTTSQAGSAASAAMSFHAFLIAYASILIGLSVPVSSADTLFMCRALDAANGAASSARRRTTDAGVSKGGAGSDYSGYSDYSGSGSSEDESLAGGMDLDTAALANESYLPLEA